MSLALAVLDAPLRLVEVDGRASEGRIFLHALAARPGRPETIAARLNDPGLRFLPLRVAGRFELVHLEAIAYVECVDEPPEIAALLEVGAIRAAVEIELGTGERLSGDLIYERPAGSARVSDLLNATGERFLLLASPHLTRFVRRDAIRRLREA